MGPRIDLLSGPIDEARAKLSGALEGLDADIELLNIQFGQGVLYMAPGTLVRRLQMVDITLMMLEIPGENDPESDEHYLKELEDSAKVVKTNLSRLDVLWASIRDSAEQTRRGSMTWSPSLKAYFGRIGVSIIEYHTNKRARDDAAKRMDARNTEEVTRT